MICRAYAPIFSPIRPVSSVGAGASDAGPSAARKLFRPKFLHGCLPCIIPRLHANFQDGWRLLVTLVCGSSTSNSQLLQLPCRAFAKIGTHPICSYIMPMLWAKSRRLRPRAQWPSPPACPPTAKYVVGGHRVRSQGFDGGIGVPLKCRYESHRHSSRSDSGKLPNGPLLCKGHVRVTSLTNLQLGWVAGIRSGRFWVRWKALFMRISMVGF